MFGDGVANELLLKTCDRWIVCE